MESLIYGSQLDNYLDSPRTLLFGLLTNCLFPTTISEDCPLWELRESLTIDKKYEFVLKLTREEVESILVQHEKCFEKRFKCFWQE
jgi:hypothetical protein